MLYSFLCAHVCVLLLYYWYSWGRPIRGGGVCSHGADCLCLSFEHFLQVLPALVHHQHFREGSSDLVSFVEEPGNKRQLVFHTDL